MIERLFSLSGSLPLILQAEKAECALACLAMVAGYHGFKSDLNSLRSHYGVSSRGATLADIINTGEGLGLSVRALKFELDDLTKISTPAILHWDFNHFVVLKSATRKKIVIHNPAVGIREYSMAEAGKHLTGIAVECSPTADFKKATIAKRTKIADLFVKSPSFYRALTEVLVLTFFLQLAVIASPFYIQLVIDQGLARRDPQLMHVIVLGFLCLVFAKVAITCIRSLMLMYISNQIGFQMVSGVFRHIISLPTEYFSKRRIGDISSRFGSISGIRQLISNDLVIVLMDSGLSIITIIVMFVYSPFLSVISLCFVLALFIFRMVTIPGYKRRQEEALIVEANSNSNFMENIRTISIIKMYCRELQRFSLWKNGYVDVVNAGAKAQKYGIMTETINNLLSGTENVVIVWLAFTLVFAGDFTTGQMMAFIFLKNQFSESFRSSLGKIADMRLIKLQLERLSDITCSEKEFDNLEKAKFVRPFHGNLELKDVGFSYEEGKSVFDRVNLVINKGDVVVIQGNSGAGKSTLLGIMMGLVKPTIGKVFIENTDMEAYGVRNYRSSISAVLQTEQLLTGTIAENISLFDDRIDEKKLILSAQLAHIHNDILSTSMGYSSLLGELGSTMSKGQAQRLLIARAIYNNPKIFFLDEAMANLNPDLERAVIESLIKLKKTIVLISHSQVALDYATKVVELRDGGLYLKPADPESAQLHTVMESAALKV